MKCIVRFIALCAVLILINSPSYEKPKQHSSKLLTFNDLKHFIAFYESTNGKYKFHRNKDGSVDCGVYQINSSHFAKHRHTDNSIAMAFDSVFNRYGVGKSVSERVTENIRNDKLNEELARTLYYKRGIDQWVAYSSFKKYLKGYIYIH